MPSVDKADYSEFPMPSVDKADYSECPMPSVDKADYSELPAGRGQAVILVMGASDWGGPGNGLDDAVPYLGLPSLKTGLISSLLFLLCSILTQTLVISVNLDSSMRLFRRRFMAGLIVIRH